MKIRGFARALREFARKPNHDGIKHYADGRGVTSRKRRKAARCRIPAKVTALRDCLDGLVGK